MRLAFLDTETTGLDPSLHEVIEFAAIVVDDTKGTVVRYQTKIKPVQIETAHPKALEVNGYSPEAWGDAAPMTKVGHEIATLLDKCVLVGHNVSFDEAMLKANMAKAKVEARIPYRKIDTQVLVMEHLFPLGLKRASLDSVRDFLGWDKENSHTAMKDTEDAKRLFEILWRMTPWDRFILRMKLLIPKVRRRRWKP